MQHLQQSTPTGRAPHPRTALLSASRASVASGASSVHSRGSTLSQRHWGGTDVMVTVPTKALDFVLETSASLSNLLRAAREEERLLAPVGAASAAATPRSIDGAADDALDDLDQQLMVAEQLASAAVDVLRRFLPTPVAVDGSPAIAVM
tara:strand:- start:1359 stop:1805 length:447 start_codon:yes stop_codon:yes gene_type:complete